jgi:hypothetical protein
MLKVPTGQGPLHSAVVRVVVAPYRPAGHETQAVELKYDPAVQTAWHGVASADSVRRTPAAQAMMRCH